MLQVEIRIKGQISEQWSDWFEGLQISPLDPNETLLSGTVIDQASLYSMLTKVRDLGLTLVSVQTTELDKEKGLGVGG